MKGLCTSNMIHESFFLAMNFFEHTVSYYCTFNCASCLILFFTWPRPGKERKVGYVRVPTAIRPIWICMKWILQNILDYAFYCSKLKVATKLACTNIVSIFQVVCSTHLSYTQLCKALVSLWASNICICILECMNSVIQDFDQS